MAKQRRDKIWQEIGESIDEACLDSGKSMIQIAEETGVTEETLRLWRRGAAFPNQKNWESLARVLNMSVRDLLLDSVTPKRRLKLSA